MNGSNEVVANEPLYLACEKRHVFALLMCAGGYMGAFTYVLRGGVFCNAQTANFVLLSISLGQGHFARALYYLLPMTAYFIGAVVSEMLPDRIKSYGLIRWDTLLVGLEIIVLFCLGFLPESAPFQITQVVINFIASMQYNTFRQAGGIPMATTFCTNHLRQAGIYITKWLQKRNAKSLNRILIHIGMLGSFVIGGIICTVLCPLFNGKALWGAIVPLLAVFVELLYADLRTEHLYLSRTPSGH